MNVFITGGTGGIGLGLTNHYLKAGARVGICGGTKYNFDQLFENPPANLYFYDLDVTNREKTKEIIAEFSDGKLDLLICSAGINNNKPHDDLPLDFNTEIKILNINLMGTVYSFEAALAIMEKQKEPGHLVAVSSAAGIGGFPEAPAYCTSKAALLTLCESLSIRYQDKFIAVTAVAPGYIDTPLARATIPNFEKKSFTLTVKECTKEIIESIEKKRPLHIFPFPIRFFGLFLRRMPRAIFRKLCHNAFKKTVGKNGHE